MNWLSPNCDIAQTFHPWAMRIVPPSQWVCPVARRKWDTLEDVSSTMTHYFMVLGDDWQARGKPPAVLDLNSRPGFWLKCSLEVREIDDGRKRLSGRLGDVRQVRGLSANASETWQRIGKCHPLRSLFPCTLWSVTLLATFVTTYEGLSWASEQHWTSMFTSEICYLCCWSVCSPTLLDGLVVVEYGFRGCVDSAKLYSPEWTSATCP